MKTKKEVVDVSVHIMHWRLNTNQISASKCELSHSAKITVSVMQYNVGNRARTASKVTKKKGVCLRVFPPEVDVLQ